MLQARVLGTMIGCVVGAAIASHAALPGCARREPVLIGFVGGLSGRAADLGISGRDGATLAVEERNRAGGVLGRSVRLLVRSDEQDVETARRVDRELIGQGVVAIVGHMTSAMSVAALPIANEARVPLVSPTTTTTDLEGLDDQFIRVTATTRDYAARMARYLRRARGLAVVSVVYDLGNRSYTESWLEHFRNEFTAQGGRIARAEAFTSGKAVHFETLARQAAAGVDGVVLIANSMDAAMLCQQVQKTGAAVAVAGAEWASTEQLLELGGSAVEGMVVSQFFDRASTAPRYREFKAAYRARFGAEPGFAAVNAYDAVAVVIKALERRGREESLKDAMLRVSAFDCLQGPLKIDRFGDADRPSRLAIVERGAFRVVDGS
jgi:branched-chain amino acid transport system substrate-binding protein